ncbi:NACHT, LRR and PYD domains-containing protein 1b allele 2-like isoform X2 [Triplophysa dalaica]|uniref:NACHT, LRR and PYD domains-containing protein 1b allele 2-like isoform X2 n=1 Tax=Triplophysa dalaica TaxID=1582913 RepID=UPI0024DF9BF8|nr:NACHT, LRR and PYD domains-containing protein 1b allele 2-like isoform X2 [Triplophysa dalaica]
MWSSFGASNKKIMVERSTLLEVLQSVSGLKKVHLHVESWTEIWVSTILSLTKTCSSLNELRINASIPLALTQLQRASLKQKGWTLTVWRMSMFIERDKKSLTEEGLKTGKREKKVFSPDITDDESKDENTHRFFSPHAGQFQCSLTNLVFVMEGKGEMLYKMVPWDPCRLDALSQMEPAGPLYDINCSKGSVLQLHLPHCEILTEENKESLAVAHFTNGTVEILQPLKVTETHVIISITELCWFGIIKKLKKKMFPGAPTCAQVLLFLRPITVAQNQKILNVYLLPGNVPLPEVQRQHQEKKYIETSSICHLISGRKYTLSCHPDECEVQPPDEVFERKFGTNFHTTFEVFLDVKIEEIRLGLRDTTEEGKEVWKPRRIPLSDTFQDVQCSVDRRFTESEYVDKHRHQLIQKVTSVMEIADCLRSKGMILGEMYNKMSDPEYKKQGTTCWVPSSPNDFC